MYRQVVVDADGPQPTETGALNTSTALARRAAREVQYGLLTYRHLAPN